jgi:hypothetical protein
LWIVFLYVVLFVDWGCFSGILPLPSSANIEFCTIPNLFSFAILQSSLAAARADNFYDPPEWSPKKV